MGLLDIFGGSGPEKAKKLRAKVTQKYGDPTVRQKAITQLGEMKIPEAVPSLLARFTITVEPLTTDSDEKEHVLELVKGFGQGAIGPITEFLRRSEQASSWAIRLLSDLLPEPEVIGIAVEQLKKLGSEYARDPEKKMVLIQFVTGKADPRIASMLHLLTAPETARRVQTAVVGALHESGFGVQGYREKVEALLSDPYFVDKGGLVKKRG